MKFCEKCGKQLEDDAIVCMGCGCSTVENKVSSFEDLNAQEKKPVRLSLVSTILGIVGILSGPIGILLGILGLVFVKKGKEKDPDDNGFELAKKLSIAAIVVGSCIIGLPILFFVVRALAVVVMGVLF